MMALWQGDVAYEDGNVDQAGPRRRLVMEPGSWRIGCIPERRNDISAPILRQEACHSENWASSTPIASSTPSWDPVVVLTSLEVSADHTPKS